MDEFLEKCKNHLKRAHFTLGQETLKHNRIVWIDIFFAFVYSLVSLYSIWTQKVDVIVLGLNILCVIRAIISNELSACKITDLIETSGNIENTYAGGYNHYHYEAIGMCLTTVYSIIVWLVLLLATINVNTSSKELICICRIFASITIFIVFVSEFEDILVYAYDAKVI